MDDLLTDFIAETRETLEAIAGEIVAWEADPADRTRLDAIFRFVHTVKGSCGFLDLPRLQRLSHAAEDALADVRGGKRQPDAALVSAVLAVIDRIGELTDAMESGEALSDSEDNILIGALTATSSEPAADAAAATKLVTPRGVSRSIRLPVELLDRLMAGVSDMVLARNELSRALRAGDAAVIDPAFERMSLCVGEIRDAITRTRMARIDGLFSLLPRMVRDLAGHLGRQVQLELDGGDVELDREMIEMIRDPLTHIVRNAIDHGIEGPDDRTAQGKPATGRLRVTARQSGNQILIEAADDGRGIDGEKLARKAAAAGLLTHEQIAGMSWAAKLDLIFMAGLSTASAVTEISGRGVGMDVVRANIERIGGTVDIDSRPGHGLKLTLRVPLTLTIIPALIVATRGHSFAIPRSAIDEIVRPTGEAVRLGQIGDALIASIRGRNVPMVDLGQLLECERPDSEDFEWPVLVVLRTGSGERFALSVDQVLDHEELVVKPAAPPIMALGLYAGTTLPDNSRPIMLLDVARIAVASGVAGSTVEVVAEPAPVSAEPTVPTLLIIDSDGIERGIRLDLVERIEDVGRASIAETGGRQRLALRGEIVPLVSSAPLPDDQPIVRILQLGDGTTRMAYAIRSVVDVIDLPTRLTPAAVPGPIAGVTLVGDRQVELLEPHWLFAEVSRLVLEPAARPLCRIADHGDPWARQLLQPLLTAAGYRVVLGDDEQTADVVIASADAALSDDGNVPVVRLRAAPHAPAGEPSIWRYDREGLLGAVEAAARRRMGSR